MCVIKKLFLSIFYFFGRSMNWFRFWDFMIVYDSIIVIIWLSREKFIIMHDILIFTSENIKILAKIYSQKIKIYAFWAWFVRWGISLKCLWIFSPILKVKLLHTCAIAYHKIMQIIKLIAINLTLCICNELHSLYLCWKVPNAFILKNKYLYEKISTAGLFNYVYRICYKS